MLVVLTGIANGPGAVRRARSDERDRTDAVAARDGTYSAVVFSPGSQAPLTMARRFVRMLSAACVLLLVAVGASPAFAADVVAGARTYQRAATVLGSDVAVWRPTYTAGLPRRGPIDVIAYGKSSNRATFAGATYGKRMPSFTIAQKGAADRWAARPVDRAEQGLVETVAVRIGAPGSKRVVRARVFADCRGQDSSNSDRRRCDRRDVVRFGGSVELLARTMSSGKPLASDIRIDSQGLTYAQLVRVASGLVPVTK